MLIFLKELWRALKSLRMKSGKANQSKSALKNDGAFQFEPTKNANIFKDFYSILAGRLVRKLPVALKDLYSILAGRLVRKLPVALNKINNIST